MDNESREKLRPVLYLAAGRIWMDDLESIKLKENTKA